MDKKIAHYLISHSLVLLIFFKIAQFLILLSLVHLIIQKLAHLKIYHSHLKGQDQLPRIKKIHLRFGLNKDNKDLIKDNNSGLINNKDINKDNKNINSKGP